MSGYLRTGYIELWMLEMKLTVYEYRFWKAKTEGGKSVEHSSRKANRFLKVKCDCPGLTRQQDMETNDRPLKQQVQ